MPRNIPWLSLSMMITVCVVGVVLGPLLAGFVPFGGDPVLIYQPIKTELARALSNGGLPFWSDRLGLGVPLVAESHVAALYPPNWLFYRLCEVGTAYRVMMWLHMVALSAATFAYARALGISQAGASLAGFSFALCGFQAVHAPHEPFYHVMPYLPLCLLLADRYARTGRLVYLAALAIAWGIQLTLGHFQIQMWTGGLVLMTGAWRALFAAPGPSRRLARICGLFVGLGWGAAIAWVQLRLTWELTVRSAFVRPPEFLVTFFFPISHWAQFALPEVFLGRTLGNGDDYWMRHGTASGEACAYVGIVPMILAVVGWVAMPRDRALTVWRLVVPLSFVLATMTDWWPDGYFAIVRLPVFGWFRSPARYTLLTSFGLVLLAGRGLDHAIASRRFWAGMALAILFGAGAWAWSIRLAGEADFQAGMGADTFSTRFALAGIIWALALAAIIAWRRNRVGGWAPVAVALLELGGLFYLGPIRWDWGLRLPEASPLLLRLAKEPGVGLVGGRIGNLPVLAGRTVAYPTLGLTAPPPNYLLEAAMVFNPGKTLPSNLAWQRRLGVTHGIWGAGDDVRGTEVLAEIADPNLDRLLGSVPALSGRGPWKLVRNPDVSPSAWVARKIREAKDWPDLYTGLILGEVSDEAWFLSEDHPPPLPVPNAQVARVQSWDGETAVVDHDGSCVLVLRRTYYPGWVYQVDGGPEQPVHKVNGGVQGVRLLGSGTSRVLLRYQPTGLGQAAKVTFTAMAAAVLVLATAGLKTLYGMSVRQW